MDATRLLQGASTKLCDKGETHVILSIDKVTKAIKIFGDEKSVDLMVDDGPLMQRIQDILQDVRRQNESSNYKMYTMSRFHLFADIGSAQWTGASKIRAQASQFLSLHGYGHKDSGKRFAEGDPPDGWPTPYVWTRYGGPSTATISMNTQILMGIMHHQKAPAPDSDQQQVGFHCFFCHCLTSISSITPKTELLQDEVGAQDDVEASVPPGRYFLFVRQNPRYMHVWSELVCGFDGSG